LESSLFHINQPDCVKVDHPICLDFHVKERDEFGIIPAFNCGIDSSLQILLDSRSPIHFPERAVPLPESDGDELSLVGVDY